MRRGSGPAAGKATTSPSSSVTASRCPTAGVVVADIYRQLMRAPVLAEHVQAVSTMRAEEVTAPTVSRIL
jgi:hypothetical protein